jgi:hypothetical protein
VPCHSRPRLTLRALRTKMFVHVAERSRFGVPVECPFAQARQCACTDLPKGMFVLLAAERARRRPEAGLSQHLCVGY